MAATLARLLRTGVLRDIPELLGYERERGPDSNFWRRAWTGGKETSDRFEPRSQHTLYHFKLRGIKEFSNGPMESRRERDETIQQWTNFNGAIGKSNADGLTAENLIAKDPSADLPEPSKFVETPICCWVKRTLATLYKK